MWQNGKLKTIKTRASPQRLRARIRRALAFLLIFLVFAFFAGLIVDGGIAGGRRVFVKQRVNRRAVAVGNFQVSLLTQFSQVFGAGGVGFLGKLSLAHLVFVEN